MAGGEQRAPGGPERVALKKEIGLVSACAIIIGKATATRPCAPAALPPGRDRGSAPAGSGTGGGGAMRSSAGRCAGPAR